MSANDMAGAELVRALRSFGEEDIRTSWLLLLQTLGLLIGVQAAMALIGPWSYPVGIPLLALLTVRLFIFFHDYLHGAIFKKSRAAEWLMAGFGYYFLTVCSVWKTAHNQHHQVNGKLHPWFMGAFPVLSTEDWANLSWKSRARYRFLRHPLNILFCHFTLFLLGQCLAMPLANPKGHWRGLLAFGLYVGALGTLVHTFGWPVALAHLAVPLFIAQAIGGLLFYVQHNAPGVVYTRNQDWNYLRSAIHTTTYFEMNPVMHWFTGNIGFHNVHHVNHFVPFYRLPEAMKLVLAHGPVPTIHWSDVPACLCGNLWSHRAGRMVSYAEATAELTGGMSPAAA